MSSDFEYLIIGAGGMGSAAAYDLWAELEADAHRILQLPW
jgi:hypothetical protein